MAPGRSRRPKGRRKDVKVLHLGQPSGRRRHQRVVLDGGSTLRVMQEDVAALRIEEGTDLDEAALTALRARAEVARATETALRLLAVRLRSHRELEQRLSRRDIAPATVRAVVERLGTEGFIDDMRFARAWVRGRLALRPSGAVRLRRELLRKGIAPEFIERALREAFADADERQLALDVARARMRRYRSDPPDAAYRRVAGVLQRRGFSTDAIMTALKEVFGQAAPIVDRLQ